MVLGWLPQYLIWGQDETSKDKRKMKGFIVELWGTPTFRGWIKMMENLRSSWWGWKQVCRAKTLPGVRVGEHEEKEQREDENLAKTGDSRKVLMPSDAFSNPPWNRFWAETMNRNNYKCVPSSVQIRLSWKHTPFVINRTISMIICHYL